MSRSTALLRYLEYNENEEDATPSRTAMAMNRFQANMDIGGRPNPLGPMQAMAHAMRSIDTKGPGREFSL